MATKRKAIDKLQNRLLKAYRMVESGEVTLAEFVGNLECLKFMANMEAWEDSGDLVDELLSDLPDSVKVVAIGMKKEEDGIDS